MRTVLLASLRVNARRYLAAALAVAVSVGFVVAVGALSGATEDSLTRDAALPYQGVEQVVTGLDGDVAVELGDRAVEAGGEVTAILSAPAPVTGSPRTLGSVSTDPGLQWQTLLDGTYPEGVGEALVQAGDPDIGVGDTLAVGLDDEVVVVGSFQAPLTGSAQLLLTWSDLRGFAADDGAVTLGFSAPPADLAEQVELLASDASVLTAEQHVAALQQQASAGVDVVTTLLLVFAVVALLVSAIVISNTFAILFAQRRHETALLRCVGATTAQVRRAVRREALALGVVASLVGLVAGVALGVGLLAAAGAAVPAAGLEASLPSPVWLLAGLLLGTSMTVGASWLPTRAVTRVDPLAAMRPEAPGAGDAPLGRGRVLLGAGLVVLGAVGLALAVARSGLALMLLGGVASFVGVLVLGPLVVPSTTRLAGRALAAVAGIPGRLAADNAVRDRRRTATTTASLLVGVTLATAVLTGLSSVRGSLETGLGEAYPVDASLVATDAAITDETVRRVSGLDHVERVQPIDGVVATASAGPGSAGQLGEIAVIAPSAADLDQLARTTDSDFLQPQPGTVTLSWDLAGAAGDADDVTLRVGESQLIVTRAGAGDSWGPGAVVAPETLAELTDSPQVQALWVRATDDRDTAALVDQLGGIADADSLQLVDQLSNQMWVQQQLDVVVVATLGLLGVAVMIALVGVANTLGLSVVERGREHALLRALGLTRRQLRRTLTWEALLLTLVATVVGTALGVVYAWVGLEVVLGQGPVDAALAPPWGQLALVLLVAALAGLAAGVLPARHAARVAPAAGLALD